MLDQAIIKWLLDSDVSIQYQVYRDLLDMDKTDLQERISKEGWGAKFLSMRNKNGHWGLGFYQPKWISSHYTILDLKNLNISSEQEEIKDTIYLILRNEKCVDGGVNPASSISKSDVCINGMFLNYACYFRIEENDLKSIVNFILSMHMKDGGFNCQLNRKGAQHSSLHTTISVLEGILEYKKSNYTYRLDELLKAEKQSREFILVHKLFKSDKTGEVIKKQMLTLSHPSRWYYDILRALEYFQAANTGYDDRMCDAIEIILKKRNKDGTWNLQAHHPGQRHFEMENVGKPSRWNTLRALKVLKHFNVE